MAGYLSWRLAIDFLKPQPRVHGLNVIQWACMAGLLALGVLYMNDRRTSRRMAVQHVVLG